MDGDSEYEQLMELLADAGMREFLAWRAHPDPERAKLGETRLTWALRLLLEPGDDGKREALNYIEEITRVYGNARSPEPRESLPV